MSCKPIPGSGKCRELYSTFLLMFPQYKDQIRYYGPFDRKSIRITDGHTGKTYIFTYENENVWSFQTEKSLLNQSKSIK